MAWCSPAACAAAGTPADVTICCHSQARYVSSSEMARHATVDCPRRHPRIARRSAQTTQSATPQLAGAKGSISDQSAISTVASSPRRSRTNRFSLNLAVTCAFNASTSPAAAPKPITTAPSRRSAATAASLPSPHMRAISCPPTATAPRTRSCTTGRPDAPRGQRRQRRQPRQGLQLPPGGQR